MALITVMVVKAFLFDVFTIPSSSMEASLVPGDVILVNKFKYGVRLPQTPIAFPLAHQYIPFLDQVPAFSDVIELPYLRFFKSDVKRNDVVVFNYPMNSEFPIDHRDYYIKRCVGLPGDNLKIDNQAIYINDSLVEPIKTAMFNYRVQTNTSVTNDSFLVHGIIDSRITTVKDVWEVTCVDSLAEELKKVSFVSGVDKMTMPKGVFADYIFPYDSNYPFNLDYFGSIQIPAKGESVVLNAKNLPLYKRIIKVYEANDLVVEGEQIKINGEAVNEYTFKMDYYFMLGDNRYNSSDARFWGFLPEDHIIGKATNVLFSLDTKADFERDRSGRWLERIQ